MCSNPSLTLQDAAGAVHAPHHAPSCSSAAHSSANIGSGAGLPAASCPPAAQAAGPGAGAGSVGGIGPEAVEGQRCAGAAASASNIPSAAPPSPAEAGAVAEVKSLLLLAPSALRAGCTAGPSSRNGSARAAFTGVLLPGRRSSGQTASHSSCMRGGLKLAHTLGSACRLLSSSLVSPALTCARAAPLPASE